MHALLSDACVRERQGGFCTEFTWTELESASDGRSIGYRSQKEIGWVRVGLDGLYIT